ncbi:hypothetical protein OROGR_006228 [Orobanche gracilis]
MPPQSPLMRPHSVFVSRTRPDVVGSVLQLPFSFQTHTVPYVMHEETAESETSISSRSTGTRMEAESTGAADVFREASQADDGVVASSWLFVDDETAMELSKLLDLSETAPPVKVRFADDPYSSPVIFQSSAAYITINGNEESCGSSFSDSESSVMASIDVGGVKRNGCDSWLDCGETREWFTEGSIGEADVDLLMELGGFLNDGCDYHDDREDAMWVEFLQEVSR